MGKLDLDSLKSTLPESLWGLVESDLTSWAEKQEASLDTPNEYEPYKEALDGLTPEQLLQTRKFAEWYERDQEGFIQQIAQHLGYDLNKPGSNPLGNNPDDDDDDSEIPPALKKQLAQLTDVVTKQGTFLTEQARLTKEEKAQSEFQNYLSGLRETHKNIWSDSVEKFVVARIAAGDSADNAIKELKDIMTPKAQEQQVPSNNPLEMLGQQIDSGGQQQTDNNGAPIVIGAGDLPSNKRSITDLSDNETTDLVAEIAKKFQSQGS